LIENSIVNIEIELFREMINTRIEKLEPLDDKDIINTNINNVKKTHIITKEFLVELKLDD